MSKNVEHVDPWLICVNVTRAVLHLSVIGFIVLVVCLLYRAESERTAGDDAVVLTKAGTVTAQWNYQQLPMHECRWCRRTVNLNRHHAVPQAANPALRDVRENLIVLCRDCHFVLGHRCNWKQYNPDVMYIATHFTNCVKSADTRAEIERPARGAPVESGTDLRESVTNRASLDEVIGRLFNGTESQHSN